MIEYSRTYDRHYIKHCLTHPNVWRMSVDDEMAQVNPKLYFVPMNINLYFLRIDPDYGVLMGVPLDDGSYEAHVALLPKARGKAIELCEGAVDWFMKNENCNRIVANIPSYNKLAIRLARRLGMKELGVGTEAFKRNGIAYDVIFYELKR